MRQLFIVAAALLLFPLSLFAETKAKYLFLLIGDGMGQNTVKLYRDQVGKTSFDHFGAPVLTGTNNFFDKTTDSAASGTALACGIKTYNGAIGMNKDGVPVMSLAKLLQRRGMKIGIISSVGINDATPGTHYANRLSRKDYAGTISDLFVSGFDFFGISSVLKPAELPDKDLYFMLKRNKFTIAKDKQLYNLKSSNKNAYFTRMAAYGSTRFRSPAFPLAKVTEQAIKLLDNPNGFFLMVEGGAIDHFNHRNESAGMMWEMSEFDKAIATVLEFAEKHPDETLVVVTADHETGGLTLLGDAPKDFWKKQPASYNTLDKQLKKMLKAKASKDELIAYACKSVGIDAATLSAEAQKVIDAAAVRFMGGKKTEKGSMYGKYNPLLIAVFHERDARSNIKYTTFGHTNAKVFTFSRGNGAKLFTAPLENSDIPRRMSIAATGEDLIEKNKGVVPFPNVPNDFHFAVQSVSKNAITCRVNLGKIKELKITFAGKDFKREMTINFPMSRFTFDALEPDTEYTISAGKNSFKVRTLPELKEVKLRGAVLADPHTSTTPDNPRNRMHSRSGKLLADARKHFEAAKIDVLLVPGDVTDKSRPGEFKSFAKIFDKSPFTIITTPGNHDYLTDKNKKEYAKCFKTPADYRVINQIQLVTLDTWDAKLNKPANIAVIEKLDITKPAIIQTHHQLKKSGIVIRDKNAAIKDGNTPEAKKMLEKIGKSRSIIFVGHKNSAEKINIGKVMQLNCPQTTQYPCGYLMFEANDEGIAFWYVPSADIAIEEFSRRLGSFANREKFALKYWNAFYKWDN